MKLILIALKYVIKFYKYYLMKIILLNNKIDNEFEDNKSDFEDDSITTELNNVNINYSNSLFENNCDIPSRKRKK